MYFAPSLFPAAAHAYSGHAVVSPGLQDVMLRAVSPYMFGAVQKTREEAETAVAAVAYVHPAAPVDIDETFRALDASQRQRKGGSSGGRACFYRSRWLIISNLHFF